MDILGIIFLVLIGLTVLVALIVALMSIPDIRRYQRIRNM